MSEIVACILTIALSSCLLPNLVSGIRKYVGNAGNLFPWQLRLLINVFMVVRITTVVLYGCLDDFGFEHRMWVFSGRRGIHCWVADKRARNLSSAARRAIVSFIDLKKGGNEVRKKINLHGTEFHPSLE
jgi:hypothetical protein